MVTKSNKFLYILFLIFGIITILILFWYSYKKPKKILIAKGEHIFSEDLTIKENEILLIKPGAILKFGPNKRLKVYGKIIAEGTENEHIVFTSIDEKSLWRGILIENHEKTSSLDQFWKWTYGENSNYEKTFLSGLNKKNKFSFCEFDNISREDNKLTYESKFMGAIEIYNANFIIKNSFFKNIKHLGGVLAQNSYAVIINNEFSGPQIHKQINLTKNSIAVIANNKITDQRNNPQPCADGIWLVDSGAIIYKNQLSNLGDDAIDTTRSYILALENEINGAFDSGIELDMFGKGILIGNQIKNTSKGGFLISKNSKVYAADNSIENSKSGIVTRNNSTLFIINSKIAQNKKGLFSFTSIPCVLTDTEHKEVISKINQLSNKLIEKSFIEGIKNKADLLEVLEKNYQKQNNYYQYLGDIFDKKVEYLFQVVDFFSWSQNKEYFKEKTTNSCFTAYNRIYGQNLNFVENKVNTLTINEANQRKNIISEIENYPCNETNDFICFLKNKGNFKNDLKKEIEKFISKINLL